MYLLSRRKPFFKQKIGAPVRTGDALSCRGIFRRKRRQSVQKPLIKRYRDDRIPLAEEIDLLFVVEALRTGIERHDIIRAGIAFRHGRRRHLLIGMELCTHRKIRIYGIPAARIPRRNESADNGSLGIKRAVAFSVMLFSHHFDSP